VVVEEVEGLPLGQVEMVTGIYHHPNFYRLHFVHVAYFSLSLKENRGRVMKTRLNSH